jgi:hypothetical protein
MLEWYRFENPDSRNPAMDPVTGSLLNLGPGLDSFV